MNKLKIELNNNIEIVNTNTISKLYNVTKSIPEPKEDEEDKAYLSGNLLVNKSYRSQVDYLMNRFKDLNINVGNYYIEFEDPEVLRVLLTNNIGDGIGVTTEEASTTAINLIFKNNTVIENFDEFKYFKGDYTLSNTFNGCINLKSVTIPNSVTNIGGYAFDNCTGLTSITIGNSVTSIDWDAFGGCSGLKKVIVPDIAAWCNISFGNYTANPLYYAKHIYSDENTEITDLVIPNSVTRIGSMAFRNCSSLTSIEIPNSVTSISDYAFLDCSSLTSVTIPNSVTSIRSSVFSLCSGLTSIVVKEGNIKYDSRDNCNAIIETASNTLILGCKTTVIPNSVTTIGNSAFDSCTGLTSITIPNSVTAIGNYAFRDCSGLTTITSLATTAPTIQSSTFQNVKTGGTLRVPSGSTGYDEWMNYLGSRGWTKVEQ